jgi:hypothetical protein
MRLRPDSMNWNVILFPPLLDLANHSLHLVIVLLVEVIVVDVELRIRVRIVCSAERDADEFFSAITSSQ